MLAGEDSTKIDWHVLHRNRVSSSDCEGVIGTITHTWQRCFKVHKSNLSCSISEAALLMVNVYMVEVSVSRLLVLRGRDVPQLEAEESLTVLGKPGLTM